MRANSDILKQRPSSPTASVSKGTVFLFKKEINTGNSNRVDFLYSVKHKGRNSEDCAGIFIHFI